jgi:hypothetical protein
VRMAKGRVARREPVAGSSALVEDHDSR